LDFYFKTKDEEQSSILEESKLKIRQKRQIIPWFNSAIRGGYNNGILRNTASCTDWTPSQYNDYTNCDDECVKTFPAKFCPVYQSFYDTVDSIYTQCCVDSCSSASTATTCSFADLSIIITCGGIDISCLIALSSAQIYITGVGAVSQCPGVSFHQNFVSSFFWSKSI